MATPYSIECVYRTRSGKTGQLHLTASDVATALYLAPSGTGDHVLSSEDAKIVQMLYSNTPATTTTATVWINGQNTGIVLVGAANAPAAVNPQINERTAIYVPGGSNIRFIQV